MAKGHKDLPGGSQDWAAEVDKGLAKIADLEAIIRRLADNAGIDMANPRRGVNSGDTPSVKNPVGQKLSSLADVQSYSVLDKQVLTWSQAGQAWLPATLPSLDGTIDITEVSYSGLTRGYGEVTDLDQYAYTAAGVRNGAGYVDLLSSDYVYIGAGDGGEFPIATIELARNPGEGVVALEAWSEDFDQHTRLYLNSGGVVIQYGTFRIEGFPTANRPATNWEASSVWDADLKIPIWWNGTTWTNALGTAV